MKDRGEMNSLVKIIGETDVGLDVRRATCTFNTKTCSERSLLMEDVKVVL